MQRIKVDMKPIQVSYYFVVPNWAELVGRKLEEDTHIRLGFEPRKHEIDTDHLFSIQRTISQTFVLNAGATLKMNEFHCWWLGEVYREKLPALSRYRDMYMIVRSPDDPNLQANIAYHKAGAPARKLLQQFVKEQEKEQC